MYSFDTSKIDALNCTKRAFVFCFTFFFLNTQRDFTLVECIFFDNLRRSNFAKSFFFRAKKSYIMTKVFIRSFTGG